MNVSTMEDCSSSSVKTSSGSGRGRYSLLSASTAFINTFRTHRHRRLLKRSNGRSQARHVGLGRHYFGFLKDGFTTLVNSRWIVIIICFTFLYVASWIMFTCLWMAVIYAHDHFNNTCVTDIHDFSGAFVFSVVTQTTIGYGSQSVESGCILGIVILMIQSLFGLGLDSVLLGLIFSKMTRPRNRRKTLIFSDVAVVHNRKSDGIRVLQFQIADPRHDSVVECHVRLQLYWNRPVDDELSRSGEHEVEQHDLDIGYDTGKDRVFLLAPVLVTHVINETSPLYGITPIQMQGMDLEIVVILEGIVEATGLTVQALWSYTQDEIVFNCRFRSPVYRRGYEWEVNFSRLNELIPTCDTL